MHAMHAARLRDLLGDLPPNAEIPPLVPHFSGVISPPPLGSLSGSDRERFEFAHEDV
ncbi:MAG: hypothetical protein ACLP22_01600 [Solirubrobacteraceae bacterium]